MKKLAEENKHLVEVKTLNGNTIYATCDITKTSIKQLKSNKCTHCKSEINRDVNGARNILLKNISKYLSS